MVNLLEVLKELGFFNKDGSFMTVKISAKGGDILIRNKDHWSLDYPVRFEYKTQMQLVDYIVDSINSVLLSEASDMIPERFFDETRNFAKIMHNQQVDAIKTLVKRFPKFKNELQNQYLSESSFYALLLIRADAYGKLNNKNIFSFHRKSKISVSDGNIAITHGKCALGIEEFHDVVIPVNSIDTVMKITDTHAILGYENAKAVANAVSVLIDVDDSEFFQWAMQKHLL